MANCKNMLHAELDLSRPVPEICEVIARVLQSWPGRELQILDELSKSIDEHRQIIDKEGRQDGK